MRLIEITVTAKGKILERTTYASTDEAERYKAAVRSWGYENGILVGLWCATSPVTAQNEERHWLLPAEAV